MYCPKCGSHQSDESKFCKACGGNLHAVRQVVATRETGEAESQRGSSPKEQFDWMKNWEESKKRKAEMERRLGITPEVKRANEVKGGVIASCVGVGLMVFLYVFMEGLIASGVIPAHVAEILSRVWIAGVIPFSVGVGLVINGVVFSKRLGGVAAKELAAKPEGLENETEHPSLRSADTTEFITPGFSVTEETTMHLRSSGQKQ